MSQVPQAPPPGAYEPPTETTRASQGPPGGSHQQPQSQYQQQAPSYGAPSPGTYVPPQQQQSHKFGGSGGFGQILNQAVTTGKPLLNKFGKAISSKVGGKQAAQPTPQYLESYQQYQGHQQQQQQQYQQHQAQANQYPPQAQPQGQPQQQWQQGAYNNSQQQQYGGSNYATPASGHSGQSSYFGAQQQQHQSPQSPQPGQQQFQPQSPPPPTQSQQGTAPNYNVQYGGQAQNVGQQPGPFPPATGQPAQSSFPGQSQAQQPQFQTEGQTPQQQFQNQPQQPSQFQPQPQSPQSSFQAQGQMPQPQYPGGGPHQQNSFQAQAPGNMTSPSPQPAPTPPNAPGAVGQQQQQWSPATPNPGGVPLPHQGLSPVPSQHPQPSMPTPPPQQYGAAPPPPQYPNQQQQWGSATPLSPPGTNPQAPHPISPVQSHAALDQPAASGTSQTPSQAQPSPAPSVPTSSKPQAAPTEFIAELPADLGNIQRPPSTTSQSTPQLQYQAYQPPQSGQSQPSPGQNPAFTIPRRAVSISGTPLADPWSIADPNTGLPTREFLIIADLLYDGLDRKFEPQGTGILEASKLIASWRARDVAEVIAGIFEHDYYCAFACLWSLQGIPHFMVPNQPSLTPSWAAKPSPETLRIALELPPASSSYPTYIPALNRSGWYKYLFQELLAEPEHLEKLMSQFCADTYQPQSPEHPDVARRDKSRDAVLAEQTNKLRNPAVERVCQEGAARMQQQHKPQQQQQGTPLQTADMSAQDAALKMQNLHIQQPMNPALNQTMGQGGTSFPTAAGYTYAPQY